MLADGLLAEVRTFAAALRAAGAPALCNPATGALDTTRGILQAIGFKEFLPVVAAAGEAAAETEAACVAAAKRNTRRYARQQVAWIRNRFVRGGGSGGVGGGGEDAATATSGLPYPLYRLDTGDPARWAEAVGDPAAAIVAAFLADAPVGAAGAAWRVETAAARANHDWARHECATCGGRLVLGSRQWEAHLASRAHRRQVQKARRRERPANANADSEDSTADQDM